MLLTHYPVVDEDGREYHKKHMWHSIENGKDLLAILSRSPSKPLMILHGHAHRGFSAEFQGIAVHNPGSGACSFVSGSRHSAFNIYEIDKSCSDPIMTRYVHDGIDFVEDEDSSVFRSRFSSQNSDTTSANSSWSRSG